MVGGRTPGMEVKASLINFVSDCWMKVGAFDWWRGWWKDQMVGTGQLACVRESSLHYAGSTRSPSGGKGGNADRGVLTLG